MDILKQSLAPIPDEAWSEIHEQAKLRLRGNLSARKLVHVDGPHGWGFGAVNLGRVELDREGAAGGILWGLRAVLPLLEARIPFELKLSELDNVARGLKNPDLSPLEEAAFKAARFEESCVYLGFEPGGIRGMAQASPHKPVVLENDADRLVESIESGILAIEKAGIGGPFTLVLGTQPYRSVMVRAQQGYPVTKRILALLAGSIQWSPALEGGIILSARERNFELTLGQDFSIGYTSHTDDAVSLYITESFTFQVLEPAAAVECRLPGP
jgi:uncharacterized linocin/CFP29 family protein